MHVCVSVRGVKPPFASVNSKQPTTKNQLNKPFKKTALVGGFLSIAERERGGWSLRPDKDTSEERHHFLFVAAYRR